MTRLSKNMRQCVDMYNSLKERCAGITLPTTISLSQEVYNEAWTVWSTIQDDVATTQPDIPAPIKSQCIDAILRRDRAAEEVAQVNKELLNVYHWYQYQYSLVSASLDTLNDRNSCEERGIVAVLLQHAVRLEQKIQGLHAVFSNYVPALEAPPNMYHLACHTDHLDPIMPEESDHTDADMDTDYSEDDHDDTDASDVDDFDDNTL